MVKSNFTVNCEYVALRIACGVVNAIPYRVALFLAKGLAGFAFAVGFKRRRTLDRIRSVFPAMDGREACRRILPRERPSDRRRDDSRAEAHARLD